MAGHLGLIGFVRPARHARARADSVGLSRDSRRRLKNLFSADELKAVIDIVNGTVIAPAQANYMRHEIEDAISLDKLDVKWGFDAALLKTKMDRLSLSDWIVLYQWARAFWSNPDQSPDDYANAFLV